MIEERKERKKEETNGGRKGGVWERCQGCCGKNE